MKDVPEEEKAGRYVNCSPVTEEEPNILAFNCQMHPVNSFENLNNYRQTNTLCDITIKVGEKCFRAHKVVLSSASPYFHAMFTTEMKEGTADIIELHEVDPESVSLLLDFIYTSNIHILEENVQRLLPASNLLQLTSVRDACCNFLQQQLHPSNALGILLFADAHSCINLVKTAEEYVVQNFVSVSQTEEFVSLTPDRIKFFLSSDDLVVNEESLIYAALIYWVKHDVPNRTKVFAELLSYVRLPLLSREFLMLTVEPEDLIKCNSQCKDLLIEAMKYHLMPEMRRYLQSSRTRSRQTEETTSIIYALGGQSLFAIHSDCEFFNPINDAWQLLPSMVGRRARLGVGIAYDKLYAVGGFDGSLDLSLVELFDTKTRVWSSAPPMGTSRSCLGVSVLHNLIYAIGGYDGLSCLQSVERFDPLTQQWTSMAKMHSRRRYISVGVIHEHIIAAGGYDGNQHLDTCEIYDPVSNTWTQKAPLHTQRSSAGGCVLNGYFYISGGTDGSVIVTTVERYDMQLDQWITIKPMCTVRMTHALIVVSNKILAIGGNDGATSLNSVEEYDAQRDVWIPKLSMCTRRSHVAAAVILAKITKPRHYSQ